jgi:hypothetical protein
MNRESKFNWQVRVAALSIFLLGLVAGALALNAYHVWFGASSGATTKQQRFDRIFDQVQLSDPQKIEVQKVMNETREEFQNLKKEQDPQVQAIRARADEKFKGIFTPEQWEKFQNLRKDFRESEKNNSK